MAGCCIFTACPCEWRPATAATWIQRGSSGCADLLSWLCPHRQPDEGSQLRDLRQADGGVLVSWHPPRLPALLRLVAVRVVCVRVGVVHVLRVTAQLLLQCDRSFCSSTLDQELPDPSSGVRTESQSSSTRPFSAVRTESLCSPTPHVSAVLGLANHARARSDKRQRSPRCRMAWRCGCSRCPCRQRSRHGERPMHFLRLCRAQSAPAQQWLLHVRCFVWKIEW